MKTMFIIIALLSIACGAEDTNEPVNGTNGTDGKDGINGRDGINGKDGINGTNGTDGVNGTNGTDGVNGTNGKDGKDGILPTCKADTDCAQNEYCNSMGVCIRDEAEPAPECVTNSDCWDLNQQWCTGNSAGNLIAYACSAAGTCVAKAQETWSCPFGCSQGSCLSQQPECSVDAQCGATTYSCQSGSIYKNKPVCSSGTCTTQVTLSQACTYGCTDGSGCHSAPAPVCPVGASCDDGDPNTNLDTCNAFGACVGIPVQVDNSVGAGLRYIASASAAIKFGVVYPDSEGPDYLWIDESDITMSNNQSIYEEEALGVYAWAHPWASWELMTLPAREAWCKEHFVCLNAAYKTFVVELNDQGSCHCPHNGTTPDA